MKNGKTKKTFARASSRACGRASKLAATAHVVCITAVMGALEIDSPVLIGVFSTSVSLVLAGAARVASGYAAACAVLAVAFGVLVGMRATVRSIEKSASGRGRD